MLDTAAMTICIDPKTGMPQTQEEVDMPGCFQTAEVRAALAEVKVNRERLLRRPDGRLRTIREIQAEVQKGAEARRAALDATR